jgi:hypothetical protein
MIMLMEIYAFDRVKEMCVLYRMNVLTKKLSSRHKSGLCYSKLLASNIFKALYLLPLCNSYFTFSVYSCPIPHPAGFQSPDPK